MKTAGIAVIFELRDMIGDSSSQTGIRRNGNMQWVRAVPEPFYDGLFARVRAAWEIICGRAYPVAWPKPGEFEAAAASE
jgi:hypothetical protein